jgi:uncharacterized protein
MRVVIDTNVFFSSFYGGNPRRIIDLWKTGAITLCFSGPILEEYLEVLDRAFAGEPEREEIASLLLGSFNSVFTARPARIDIQKLDPYDVKFIECAVSLQAEWIVTGDRGLLRIGRYGRTRIVNPAQFLQNLS